MKKLYIIGMLWSIGIFSFSAMAVEQVRIVGILAKTGIAAEDNAPEFQMIQLAVEELNSHGGLLGQPVELIILDNESTPIGATLAAKKAVKLQATAVIGGIWSSHCLAIAPILQQEGIPMISTSSTIPKVTRIGDYIFRVCFTDSIQGKVMAQFAYTELGAQTAIVLKTLDEIYSLTLAEFFVNTFQQYGGKVLFEGNYRIKAVDFENILKEVQMLKPDVVFVPGFSRDSGLLIKQAVSMGIQTIFLGGDGFGQIHDYGSSAVEGSFYSNHWHPEVRSEKSIHLQNIYKQKYKKKITTVWAPLAYDAVMVLADAIRRAESIDRTRIRESLAGTNGFQGVTGIISFDEYGDPLNKPVVIIKLQKKDHVYFKSIKP